MFSEAQKKVWDAQKQSSDSKIRRPSGEACVRNKKLRRAKRVPGHSQNEAYKFTVDLRWPEVSVKCNENARVLPSP